ncbi:MAG TPA: hypothetical protein VF581_07905 [Flavobacterium sp.]
MTILDKNNQVYYTSSFSNDETLVNFKIVNRDKVIAIAKIPKLTTAELARIITEMDIFVNAISADTPLANNREMEQLWFHHSIITTMKRGYDSANCCECTVHPFYLTGKTPFNCMEDIIIKKSVMLQVIQDHPDDVKDLNMAKLAAYVSNSRSEDIIFKNAYNSYYTIADYNSDVEKTAPIKCPMGLGSAPGCCGNYSGCCLVHSLWCLYHDTVCTNCDRWHCGRDCIPD